MTLLLAEGQLPQLISRTSDRTETTIDPLVDR
jgi:hypothetical protein